MKMNPHQIYSHLHNLLHSFMNFFIVLKIISKFITKIVVEFILFLFYSNTPQYFHVRSVFFNLVKLINRVSYCQLDPIHISPSQISLLFDRIRVNYALGGYSKSKQSLHFSQRSTVKVAAFLNQVIQNW